MPTHQRAQKKPESCAGWGTGMASSEEEGGWARGVAGAAACAGLFAAFAVGGLIIPVAAAGAAGYAATRSDGVGDAARTTGNAAVSTAIAVWNSQANGDTEREGGGGSGGSDGGGRAGGRRDAGGVGSKKASGHTGGKGKEGDKEGDQEEEIPQSKVQELMRVERKKGAHRPVQFAVHFLTHGHVECKSLQNTSLNDRKK